MRCTLRMNSVLKGLEMKVLLLKDVYKLGHAGDVKKVADGYGRNFLLPQGLAVLASAGALQTVDRIKKKAAIERARLNQEMSGLAEQVEGVELEFVTKAGENGKLYGSITSQMVVEAMNTRLGTNLDRHLIEMEPIRTTGEHIATVRLTVDLNPKVKVVVIREGATDKSKEKKESKKTNNAEVEPAVQVVAEPVAVEPATEELVSEESASTDVPADAALEDLAEE